MSAIDDEILNKVKQWLVYADEDLRLARHGMTLSTGVPLPGISVFQGNDIHR